MIYLDHAATTPVDKRVLAAMLPYFFDIFGNPSSLHSIGREAQKAVDGARDKCAEVLGCVASNVFFTSGGTESCNLAIFGVMEADMRPTKRLIVSRIEHRAVLEAATKLMRQGVDVQFVDVDEAGFVNYEQLESLIDENTVLVSVGYANNEIGVIQDVERIGRLCRSKEVLFHTDACQAIGYLPLNLSEMPIDLVTVSASKIYGPKGVGILAMADRTVLSAQIVGGGQERDLRSGTENVVGIVGMAETLSIVDVEGDDEVKRVRNLRDQLIEGILKIDGCTLTGSREKRLPNHISLMVSGVEGESVLLRLDQEGIAVSTGSACSSGSLKSSHVLEAIGVTKYEAYSSLRLTLGRSNDSEQVKRVLDVFKGVIADLRNIA